MRDECTHETLNTAVRSITAMVDSEGCRSAAGAWTL